MGTKRFQLIAVIAAIPIFLHLALFLFFIGLVILLKSDNKTVAKVVAISVGTMGVLYITCTIMPLFFTDCPFRTPLTKPLEHLARVLGKIISEENRGLLQDLIWRPDGHNSRYPRVALCIADAALPNEPRRWHIVAAALDWLETHPAHYTAATAVLFTSTPHFIDAKQLAVIAGHFFAHMVSHITLFPDEPSRTKNIEDDLEMYVGMALAFDTLDPVYESLAPRTPLMGKRWMCITIPSLLLDLSNNANASVTLSANALVLGTLRAFHCRNSEYVSTVLASFHHDPTAWMLPDTGDIPRSATGLTHAQTTALLSRMSTHPQRWWLFQKLLRATSHFASSQDPWRRLAFYYEHGRFALAVDLVIKVLNEPFVVERPFLSAPLLLHAAEMAGPATNERYELLGAVFRTLPQLVFRNEDHLAEWQVVAVAAKRMFEERLVVDYLKECDNILLALARSPIVDDRIYLKKLLTESAPVLLARVGIISARNKHLGLGGIGNRAGEE
jgi:hypothetical protein